MSTPPRSPAGGSLLRALLGASAVTALDAALLTLALGGLGALLAHARALALLAVWWLGGVALAWLRPVRVHDPVEVSAESRMVLPLLFLIPLVTPPLSAFGERSGLWPIPGGRALEWAGVAISAGGLVIRIAAMARLGSRFSPLVAVQRDHALETGGVYTRVRHPGYLGAWTVSLGAMLAFGSALALPLVLLMLILLLARARREDAVLERHFGEDFRRYRLRSGRFLPRLGRAGER